MKNKFKFTALFFAILVMISSLCFAESQTQTPIEPRTSDVEQINITDEAVTTNLENDATSTEVEISESTTQEEPEIYEGDLYIFEDTVNMNKLVDGNVYIIGKNVTITGQVAGNLFVIADNLTIGDDTSSSTYNGYVFYNIYALANKATLKSSCYDLYIAGNDITIDSSFYLYRDLKIGATKANIYGTVGRNVDIESRSINLKKDDNSHTSIYGNFNYSSPTEIDEETLNACVIGETTYSYITGNEETTENNTSIITHAENASIKVIFTIFVWLLVLWIAPKFLEKSPELISKKPLKTLGTGLVTLITVPIVSIILLILIVTLPISLIGLMLYVLAISIASSLVCIAATYLLKNKLNLNTWYKLLGILIILRIVLYILELIPLIGGLISFITLILGLGLVICSIIKNKKNNPSEVVIKEKTEE